MLIYRVEDMNGKGPYRNLDNDFLNGSASKKHPCPYSDGLDWQKWSQTNHVFGFETIFDCREWFDLKTRKILRRRGFLVGVYRMDARKICKDGVPTRPVLKSRSGGIIKYDYVQWKNVIKGGKQLVFYREFADHITNLDIVSFKGINTHG